VVVWTGVSAVGCGSRNGGPRSVICCWLGIIAAETTAVDARDGFCTQTHCAGEGFVDDEIAGFVFFLLDLDHLVVVRIFLVMIAQHHRTTRRPQYNV
jgi:hypothetical protein